MIDPDPTDERLRALGARAREHDAQDAAWEAVSLGTLDEDEVAQERLRAGDSPQQVQRSRALFRPLDEAEQDALVEAVRARIAAAPGSADDLRDGASSPEDAAANDTRRWWIVGLALAAAVIVVLWSWPWEPGPRTEPGGDGLAIAALPAYELQTDGGLQSQRGDGGVASEVLHYRAETELSWLVRPASAVQGEIEARWFAIDDDASVGRELPAELLEVRDGSVRVTGRASTLGLERGAWRIAIVVGRPSALPSEAAQLHEGEEPPDYRVKWLRIVLE